MQTATREEKLNIYVRHTVESGVRPLQLLLTPVYDCYGGETVAYRAGLQVRSVLMGTLEPEDYLSSGADEGLLARLSLRAIGEAALLRKQLLAASVPAKLLLVRASSALLYREELYASLRALLAESGGETERCRLAVELDGGAMDADSQVLCRAFADMRAAGLLVAVEGYGSSAFPMERLLTACPDYLLTDKSLAALATDRERRAALAPLINFPRSLGGEVIACGVCSDEELRELRTRECFGFLPDPGYRGAFAVSHAAVEPEELLAAAGGAYA